MKLKGHALRIVSNLSLLQFKLRLIINLKRQSRQVKGTLKIRQQQYPPPHRKVNQKFHICSNHLVKLESKNPFLEWTSLKTNSLTKQHPQP